MILGTITKFSVAPSSYIHPMPYRLLPLLLLTALWLSGCASIVASSTARLADSLASAILDQNDPQTVQDGTPAYLLLIDGLINNDPDNPSLYITGGKLYSAYASAFAEDAVRRQRLSEKARRYGAHALCQQRAALCQLEKRPYVEFIELLKAVKPSDVPALYAYTSAWVGWIEAHASDWNAIADLPKVEAAMQRVAELEETYDHGGVHLYLGVLASLRPAALGGNPDKGREHFETAIRFSHGQNLMAKVLYAERYARLTFNRPLHDRLLHEVLEADPAQPQLTLINTLAQKRARELLANADAYF